MAEVSQALEYDSNQRCPGRTNLFWFDPIGLPAWNAMRPGENLALSLPLVPVFDKRLRPADALFEENARNCR